jgi:periplasmic copper chaperone A
VKLALGLGAVLALVSTPSAAYVGLKPNQAAAGSIQTLAFVVEHGCSGSPTVRLRVRLPEGIEDAKVLPKDGWKDSASRSNAASTRVDEVLWLGGKQEANKAAEFAVTVRLPDTPGATLYFPVVQECEKGVNRWTEVPGPGLAVNARRYPAPGMILLGKSP